MEKKATRRTIAEIKGLGTDTYRVCGWVHRVRRMKNISFIILRDRTGYIQVVAENGRLGEVQYSSEDVVGITGILKERRNSTGDYELELIEIELMNKSQTPPISIAVDDAISIDTMLNNRVLSLRRESLHPILKFQNLISDTFRYFLKNEGFTEIRTPKLVAGSAEGGANVFTLDYFGEKANLAQSPQFYKQMMVAAGYERVFEIGPVFRAEEFSTKRHLNEYTSMDLEMGFIESFEDIMDLEERFLKNLLEVLAGEEELLQRLKVTLPKYVSFPRISFSEAMEILTENGFEKDKDLSPAHEKFLCEYSRSKFSSPFIFIYDYPREKRPMYTMPMGEKGTASFDLLFNGIEITTGGQRIHDRAMLERSFINKGIDPEGFRDYIDLFSYGVPPHGGLGMGLERITAMFLGYDNIRFTSLFPRDKERLRP